MKVSGSVVVTPYNRPETKCDSASEAAMPMALPTIATRRPSPNTSLVIARGSAPNARRTPSSRVRSDTPYARMPDRKSTRLERQSRQYLVCRLLLEKKNHITQIKRGNGRCARAGSTDRGYLL